MRYLITAGIAFAIAGIFTIPKLHKMYQITGDIPGAMHETHVVTAKWDEWVDMRRSRNHYYMISWGDPAHQHDRRFSTNVEPWIWRSIAIGQPIEFLRIPGDDERYLAKDDIFVEGFTFDYGLLAAELILGTWAVIKFFNTRRQLG
jgi:hypothetical protein